MELEQSKGGAKSGEEQVERGREWVKVGKVGKNRYEERKAHWPV